MGLYDRDFCGQFYAYYDHFSEASGGDISNLKLAHVHASLPNVELIQADKGPIDHGKQRANVTTPYKSVTHMPNDDSPAAQGQYRDHCFPRQVMITAPLGADTPPNPQYLNITAMHKLRDKHPGQQLRGLKALVPDMITQISALSMRVLDVDAGASWKLALCATRVNKRAS
jgi:hypothetical protein